MFSVTQIKEVSSRLDKAGYREKLMFSASKGTISQNCWVSHARHHRQTAQELQEEGGRVHPLRGQRRGHRQQ